jgi:hypothetical protein
LLFLTREFQTYATALIEKINCTPEPSSLLLAQAFPLVANSLSRIETHSAIFSRDLAKLTASSEAINSKLDSYHVSVERKDNQLRHQLSTIFTSIGKGISPGIEYPTNTQPDLLNNIAAGSGNTTNTTICESNDTLIFKMNRSITSVKDAWMEYEHGGVDNNNTPWPAIKYLDETKGDQWRGTKSSKEGKFYDRRIPLWKSIQALMTKDGLPEEMAISAIDGICRNHCRGSLRNLCDKMQLHLKNWNEEGNFLDFLKAHGF